MADERTLLASFLDHDVAVTLKDGTQLHGLLAYVNSHEMILEAGVTTFWLPLDQLAMVATDDDLHADA